MVTTSIKNFLVTLLAEFFPELETGEGSDLYAQVVQPLLDRLGDDIFDTDIDSFVSQRIRDEFPELDIDTAGSVARDVFVNPAILLFQAIKRELQAIRSAQSLNQTSTLSSEELDSLLANVFVVRRPGSRAAGTARVYYSAPTTIQADPTISFTASNGQIYVVDGLYDITVSMMSGQVEGSLYYADIPVLALMESEDANITPGQLLSASGLPGYVKVTNPESFSNGVAQEANSALLLRAGDLITERSLVTERGVRTTVLQAYPEIKSVSVIGTGEAAMTRDIIRGSTEVLDGLGYGPVYAAGMYAWFTLTTDFDVWTGQDFPIKNVIAGLANTLSAPFTANQVYADWFTENAEVGDQVSVMGNAFTVSDVISQLPFGRLQLECAIIASSDAFAVGGTNHTNTGGPYMPSPLSGGTLTCAPMFFTNAFGLSVALPEGIKSNVDTTTDWLLVKDANYTVGVGGVGAADIYSRTKYYPIVDAEADFGGNTNITIRSQNAHYAPQEIQWVAWGAPDLATVNWQTGIAGATPINRGISVQFTGALGVGNILLVPSADVDFAAEGVQPGDIITVFGVETATPTQVTLWMEVVVDSYSGANLVCVQDDVWLYSGVGAMFPTLFDVAGPFGAIPGGEVVLALFRFYWTARKGNGAGTTTPDSSFSWPTSFLPAWELPGGGMTYVWHPSWIPGGGAINYHRQFGELFPEVRGTVDSPAVANQTPTYEPWTSVEWAILRVPIEKLPAIDETWSRDSNSPPYGVMAIEGAGPIGDDVYYPVRFYGSWYTWGLIDCGDPIRNAGSLLYRTDNWATQFNADVAATWPIQPYLSQWALRKPASADSIELGIVLSQLPEIYEEVEIPPDEIHIGGMMDVYCNPSSQPKTTLASSPWVSFEDSDVVLPTTFTGASATGGVAAAFGAGTFDDGIFTAAALVDYNWQFGDLLLITGPSGDDYYNTAYAIVDQHRYTKTQIRVYPAFPDIAAHSGLTYVVLRGVTTDLTPIKQYKVRNGTDLKTSIGSKSVSSPTSNFVDAGVIPGDVLYITEGVDLGYHTIGSPVDNTQLTLSAALIGGESNVSFEVFTSSGFASLPIITVEKVEGMDIDGAAVAVSLPYGGPLGATVRAAAMAGDALVFPAEGVESATAYTQVNTPSRVYSNLVDFNAIGVRRGERFLFTSGEHAGEAYAITEVDLSGALPVYLELGEGFEVVNAETLLTFEIGASTQGTARCYFKSAIRAVFDGDTRIGVGSGQLYMADPDTDSTLFIEDTSDTDILLSALAPTALAADGIYTGGASTNFAIPGTLFSAQYVNKYLHVTAPAALVGQYLISAVPDTSNLTLSAPMAGGVGPASVVVEWSIADTASNWTVLTSGTPINDWAVRGIRENSELAMGTRSDSDLVYIDHQDIVGTALVATVTGLSGRTFVLNINGADVKYTFTTNSILRTALPQYIEAAFPQVQVKLLEIPPATGTFSLHIFSTSDVIVGAGTANGNLGFTIGDTTVVPSALRGPFQLIWHGVGIAGDAPPISDANLAHMSLVQPGTDTPIASIAALSTKLLHIRVVRPGTQIFEVEDMVAYGGYYYVDLDISSYYPGPTQIIREQTAATSFIGVQANGFTYVADEDHAYSVIEDAKVRVNGTFSAVEYPTPVLGTSAQFTYTHAPDVASAHYFMQNKAQRTVTCNTLAKVSLPLEVAVRFSFKSSTTIEGARNIVVDYFRNLPHGTRFTVRAFTSAMRASGLLVQNTPEILVIAPNNLREYQLYVVTEEYQMPDNGAFLAVSAVLTKG